jgi:hypothetical protein
MAPPSSNKEARGSDWAILKIYGKVFLNHPQKRAFGPHEIGEKKSYRGLLWT